MKTIRRTDIFASWLKGLRDRAAAARVEIRIKRLEMGNAGQVRHLTRGVSEMKIDFGPGYRVYFVERRDEVIILLCGGSKKTQDADIRAALAMVDELED